jgi:DME family drug/metabolite transporter
LSTSARSAIAWLVTAGVLGGTGGLAGAFLAESAHLHPVAVATYRLLVGGACATAVVVATGQLRLLRANPGRLVVSGLLLAEFQAAYQVAIAEIAVSLATLVTVGCIPVFVAAAKARHARPDGRTLAALTGSLAGLTLLCGLPVDTGGHTALGVAMSLAAGAGFAVLTLRTEALVEGQGAIISAGLLLGGVLLMPAALAYGMAVPPTGEALGLVAYLGVVPTAVAYGALVAGLRRAGATAAALSTVLEPLTATLLAVAFHGERLTAAGIAGAVLVAGALALYSLPRPVTRRRTLGR